MSPPPAAAAADLAMQLQLQPGTRLKLEGVAVVRPHSPRARAFSIAMHFSSLPRKMVAEPLDQARTLLAALRPAVQAPGSGAAAADILTQFKVRETQCKR